MDEVSAPEPATEVDAQGKSPGALRSVEEMLELHRIGVVMTADPHRPEEAWGVLNPALA